MPAQEIYTQIVPPRPLIEGVIDPFPLNGPLCSYLSSDTKAMELIKMVYQDHFVIMYNNTIFLYSPLNARWLHAFSSEALRYLCDKIGANNVTVNFASAVMPYLSMLRNIAPEVLFIPCSVCIGCMRYKIYIEGECVRLHPAFCTFDADGAITEFTPDQGLQYISTFSFSSLSTRRFIYKIPNCDFTGKVSAIMLRTLGRHEFDIISWYVGNGLVDPVEAGKLFFLYGKGGEGKSFLINLLSNVLDGCVHVLSKDYIGRTNVSIAEGDILGMAASRFTIYGDVEIANGDINGGTIKLLNGGDEHSTSCGKVKILTTAFFATNELWWLKKSNMGRWRTRRSLALGMKGYVTASIDSDNTITEDDKLLYIADCIKYRMTCPRPTLDPTIVLVTIFGAKCDIATRGIVLSKTADFASNYSATLSLAFLGGLAIEALMDMVESIEPNIVVRDPMFGGLVGQRVIHGLSVRRPIFPVA